MRVARPSGSVRARPRRGGNRRGPSRTSASPSGRPRATRRGRGGARERPSPRTPAPSRRLGGRRVETAIAASSAGALAAALANWQGAVDEIVLRAITGTDTIDENLALLRAIPRPAPGTPR